MKILAISEDFPILTGGRLSFFKICENIFASGQIITVFSSHGKTQELLRTKATRVGLKLFRRINYVLFPLLTFFYVLRYGSKYDVILTNWGVSSILAIIPAKIVKTPIVVINHHIASLKQHLQYTQKKFLSLVYAILEYLLIYSLLPRYDAVLTVNPLSTHYLKTRNKRVYFVGNPIC